MSTLRTETIALENVDLAYFKPIVERYSMTVRQGRLSAFGNVEYGTDSQRIDIAELRVRSADMDYIHKKAESVATTAGKEVDSAAKKYSDTAELVVNIDKVRFKVSWALSTRRAIRSIVCSGAISIYRSPT